MDDRLLLKLAGEYGTPLYVYDGVVVKKRYLNFKQAFSRVFGKVKVYYACKANASLALCSLLRGLGAGADVVSVGELKTALKVGVNPEDVIYTSNSKSAVDLKTAVEAGVTVNVDSMDELETLREVTAKTGKTARISFRVNPSVNPKTHPKIATGLRESKFGLHIEKGIALEAFKKASKMRNVKIIGLHTHIGSQIQETLPFTEAAGRMLDFACELKEKLNLRIGFIDLGGGLGIPYRGGKTLQPEQLAKAIEPAVKNGFKKMGYQPTLILEPGRYLVAESGILLTIVNSVKKTPCKTFINVDSGLNTLIRPALYDAYHQVRVLGKKGASMKCDIAGNVCETGDILARDRRLPQVKKGDVIAILDAGAYGMSMVSTYNSQPLPAEVLVQGSRVDLIRERGEQEDLYWRQKIPEDIG